MACYENVRRNVRSASEILGEKTTIYLEEGGEGLYVFYVCFFPSKKIQKVMKKSVLHLHTFY